MRIGITLLSVLKLVHTTDGAASKTAAAKDDVCIGCHAVVNELVKMHGKDENVKASFTRIADNPGELCVNDRFLTYDLIPPKMVKACNQVFEKWGDVDEVMAQLMTGILNGNSDEERKRQCKAVCKGTRLNFRHNGHGGLEIDESAQSQRKLKNKKRDKMPHKIVNDGTGPQILKPDIKLKTSWGEDDKDDL